MEKDVPKINLGSKHVVFQNGDGEESPIKVTKELRSKIENGDGWMGESEYLKVNIQNEDASISVTKGTTRKATYDVIDLIPSFKITFKEKTVISLSPPDQTTLCTPSREHPPDTSSSDAGTISGVVTEDEGETTDKRALTHHILHEISEVLDKMELTYINKVRSEFQKRFDNKTLYVQQAKDDELKVTSSERVFESDNIRDITSEVTCANGVTERYEETKRDDNVFRIISKDSNLSLLKENMASENTLPNPPEVYLKMYNVRKVKDSVKIEKVSFLGKVFSAIETFSPGFHLSRASPADEDSDSSCDDSSCDDSSVCDSDQDAEALSGIFEESYSSSGSDSDEHPTGRTNEVTTLIESRLGIPSRNYPIALYCLCFALFYLFWTMCYMSCTYRRTFYGIIRNSNTWYCKAYDSFSKLTRFTVDSPSEVVTYKSNRKYYHPFQPW